MKSKKDFLLIYLITLLLILAMGCVVITKPIYMIDTTNGKFKKYKINVKKINIIDISTVKNKNSVQLGFGFERQADTLFSPIPSELFRIKLKKSFEPIGRKNELNIFIIDAGFHVKMVAEDRMPLINIFAYKNTPRPYKCTASLTISKGDFHSKNNFSIILEKVTPSEKEKIPEMVIKCHNLLIKKVYSYVRNIN